MKSRAVTTLAVLGVLGAGSAAMAVNADTFASGPKPIGSSSSVLVPAADRSPSLQPTHKAHKARKKVHHNRSDNTNGSTGQNAPAPVVQQPVAVAPKKSSPKPSTHSGSGGTTTTPPKSDDNGSDDTQSEDPQSDDPQSDDTGDPQDD